VGASEDAWLTKENRGVTTEVQVGEGAGQCVRAAISSNGVSGKLLTCRKYRGKSCSAALVLAKGLCRVDPQDSRAGDCTCDRGDCKQEDGSTRERHRINR
jgi:hypothetical protein